MIIFILRNPHLAPDSGVVVFSASIAFVFIVLLLDRVAVVTLITPVGRNIKRNLRRLGRRPALAVGDEGNWRVGSLFYMPDKTSGK